jgi:CRP-like cAMP-binding protein
MIQRSEINVKTASSRSVSKEPADRTANRLLAALGRDEYERLLPKWELVLLPKNRILYEAGDTMAHSYFPNGGMASLLAINDDGQTIEIGTVGSEGFIGVPIIHEVRATPYRVMVQMPMTAIKMEAASLITECNRGGRLKKMLLRYAHVQETQLAQAVPCSLFHSVEQRVARRLVVTSNCVDSDTFEMTQEQLGIILSRHRNRIGAAVGELKEKGLIEHGRGQITILDRKGLEACACECYRIVKDCIERTLES